MNNETWKSIPGFEGLYCASSLGRIKALPRVLRHAYGGIRNFPEKILKSRPMVNGYWTVGLTDNNHRTRSHLVHRLVCAAFNGPPKKDQQANHINGVKDDCSSKNVEWVSPKQNQQHARDVLGHFLGIKAPRCKLTESQVLQIRAFRVLGIKREQLAKIYGVNKFNINQIWSRKTWKHI